MAKPIVISILANASQANTTLKQTATLTQRVGGGFRKLAAPSTLALGGVAALAKGVKDMASDSQQSLGATESVFKDYADVVVARSKKANQALGITANEYRELSNVTGAMLKNAGMPLKKVADLTDKLNVRAADLAATYGGSTKEAVQAVSSLLRGEADPIERYGVSIKQSDVNARLAAKGLDKLTGSSKKQAEQQARLELLFGQTKDAQGQFARESGTAANKEQRNAAKWADVRAELGTRLLPTYVKLQGQLTSVVAYLGQHQSTVLKVAAGVAILAAGVLLINGVMAVAGAVTAVYTGVMLIHTTAQKAATAASLGTRLGLAALTVQTVATTVAQKAMAAGQWLLNAAMSANPITLVVIALAAIGAAMVLAYRKSSTFRGIVQGAFKAVQVAGKALWSGLKVAFDGIKAGVQIAGRAVSIYLLPARTAFKLLVTAAKAAYTGVRSAFSSAVGFIKGIPGKIKGAFSGAKTLLSGIGGQIIDGLKAGIERAAHKVTDAASAVVNKIPKRIRKLMGIASPSKVTTRLGRFISQGLAKGIDLGTSGVTKVLRRQGVNTKKEYAKQAKDLSKQLVAAGRSRYATLLNQSREYAAGMRDAAKSYAGLSNMTLGENETMTGGGVKQYLTDRLAAIKNFGSKLYQLNKKGLSKDLYNQIAGMGVEQGTAYAEALSQETPAALRQINGLQSQISTASSSLGKSTSNAMYGNGVNAAKGFYEGLKSWAKKIANAGGSLGKGLIKSVKKALGIKSPSRIFKTLGQFVVKGLNIGLDERTVMKQGQVLSRSLQTGFKNPAMDAQLAAGFNASAGSQVTNHYHVTVKVEDSMSVEEQGLKVWNAIEAAKAGRLIRK